MSSYLKQTDGNGMEWTPSMDRRIHGAPSPNASINEATSKATKIHSTKECTRHITLTSPPSTEKWGGQIRSVFEPAEVVLES